VLASTFNISERPILRPATTRWVFDEDPRPRLIGEVSPADSPPASALGAVERLRLRYLRTSKRARPFHLFLDLTTLAQVKGHLASAARYLLSPIHSRARLQPLSRKPSGIRSFWTDLFEPFRRRCSNETLPSRRAQPRAARWNSYNTNSQSSSWLNMVESEIGGCCAGQCLYRLIDSGNGALVCRDRARPGSDIALPQGRRNQMDVHNYAPAPVPNRPLLPSPIPSRS